MQLALRSAGGDPAPMGAVFDTYAELLLAAPSLIARHSATLRHLAAQRSIAAAGAPAIDAAVPLRLAGGGRSP
ncbi:MAG: hypothetical protein ABI398_14485 [Devosia sp.]